MEILEELCGNLCLIEEEKVGIELDGESVDVVKEKGDRSLIGRVCIERVIGKEVIDSTMGKIWRVSYPTTFQRWATIPHHHL